MHVAVIHLDVCYLSMTVLFHQNISTMCHRIHRQNLSIGPWYKLFEKKECKLCDGWSGSRQCRSHHREGWQLVLQMFLPEVGRSVVTVRGQEDSCAPCSDSPETVSSLFIWELPVVLVFVWFLIQGSQYNFLKSKSYLSWTGGQKWNSREIKIKVTKSRNTLNNVIKAPSSLFCKLKEIEFH